MEMGGKPESFQNLFFFDLFIILFFYLLKRLLMSTLMKKKEISTKNVRTRDLISMILAQLFWTEVKKKSYF